MTDLFNIVASICILQMAVVLAMVEADRDYKREALRIVWGADPTAEIIDSKGQRRHNPALAAGAR